MSKRQITKTNNINQKKSDDNDETELKRLKHNECNKKYRINKKEKTALSFEISQSEKSENSKEYQKNLMKNLRNDTNYKKEEQHKNTNLIYEKR